MLIFLDDWPLFPVRLRLGFFCHVTLVRAACTPLFARPCRLRFSPAGSMGADSDEDEAEPCEVEGSHARKEEVSERDAANGLRYRGTQQKDVNFLKKNAQRMGVFERSSGLQYKILRKSADPNAKKPGASTVCKVHYRGAFADGTEFDSTYVRQQAMFVRPDQVVEGWGEALQLMRQGERWEICLPSHLAYGEKGFGPIPGGAVLIFDLDLVEVDAKEPSPPGYGTLAILIAALVVLVLMFLYQHFYMRSPKLPRGALISVHDVSSPLNPRVFFDLEVDGKPGGRVEFELFADVVPKTVENFRALATGERGVGKSGKPLHFKGSIFHRIIPGFMCQGGDITNGDGRGGESIYGRFFHDEWEHGVIHHTDPGLLSMANRGRDMQGSQFFITFGKAEWLDDKHVVFGRVSKGIDAVRALERVGSKSGKTSVPVVVVDCGQLGDDGTPIKVRERPHHDGL